MKNFCSECKCPLTNIQEKHHVCYHKIQCSHCKAFLLPHMFIWNAKGSNIGRMHKTCFQCRCKGREFDAKRRPHKPPRPPKNVETDNNKECSGCYHYRDIPDFIRARSKMGIPYEHETCNFCHQKYRRNRYKYG